MKSRTTSHSDQKKVSVGISTLCMVRSSTLFVCARRVTAPRPRPRAFRRFPTFHAAEYARATAYMSENCMWK